MEAGIADCAWGLDEMVVVPQRYAPTIRRTGGNYYQGVYSNLRKNRRQSVLLCLHTQDPRCTMSSGVCRVQTAVCDLPSPIDYDMAGPTLGERVLDIERTVNSLHGYAKGAVAVGLLLIAAICWWVNFDLIPEIHGLQSSLASDENRLSGVEGQLRGMDLKQRAAKAPQTVLNEITALNQQQFSKVLPALQEVTEQPFPKVSPSDKTLEEIARKLSNTSPDTPEYWPTVLQFLQFASTGLAPANVPPPGESPIFKSSSGNFLAHNVFSHTTVVLDGGTLVDNRFDNCRIIFTDKPVSMTNVTISNSVFEFPISSVPPPYIQKASRLLLASGLKTTSIPSL